MWLVHNFNHWERSCICGKLTFHFLKKFFCLPLISHVHKLNPNPETSLTERMYCLRTVWASLPLPSLWNQIILESTCARSIPAHLPGNTLNLVSITENSLCMLPVDTTRVQIKAVISKSTSFSVSSFFSCTCRKMCVPSKYCLNSLQSAVLLTK